MDRIEVAVEVAPIEPATVERLKAAGFAVYRGQQGWRVVANLEPRGERPLVEQARDFANDILLDYRLTALHSPPILTLRHADGQMDVALGALVLEDARRANDPDPIPRVHRKWWQKQMELGLGERKGD